MSDKTTWTEELKINQLYNHNYTIPIYQRNYAWGVSEVTQLIKDIADSATRRTANNKHINYYIGTLVVHETLQGGETTYETIDGQQRLTTLSILLSVIKNKYKEDLNGFDLDWFKLSITFKSRAVSTRTLELLFNREPKKLSSSEREECNKEILVAYEIVASVLKSDPEIGGD